MRVRRLLALPAVLLLVAAATAVAADKPLAVDAKAPDFSATDQYGKPFKLSDEIARHEWTVLAFYPKAFSGT